MFVNARLSFVVLLHMLNTSTVHVGPDGLTKALGWVLHSCHAFCIMGHFLNALSVALLSLL